MGFVGSVILGDEGSDPVSLSISFALGIIWRSLVFWIPIFGKLICFGSSLVPLEFVPIFITHDTHISLCKQIS